MEAVPVVQLMVGFVGVLLTMAVGFGGWVLVSIRDNIKAVRTSQDTAIGAIQDEMSALRADLSAFKQYVPSAYVMRDDYIRTISGFDQKIDDLKGEMKTLNHHIGSLVGDRRREA